VSNNPPRFLLFWQSVSVYFLGAWILGQINERLFDPIYSFRMAVVC